MNLEQFIESMMTLIKNSGNNAFFIIYAVVGVLLTQLVKKLFINKTKVEILHKFNLASILPFIFGVLSALFDGLVVSNSFELTSSYCYSLLIHGTSIGAMSVVMFRLVSSLMGGDMNTLLKDDVFACFYNQLIYFGSVKSQLADGTLKFEDFISQIKLVTSNAKQIYASDISDTAKRAKLTQLLNGIITSDNIETVVESIHKAIIQAVKKDEQNEK